MNELNNIVTDLILEHFIEVLNKEQLSKNPIINKSNDSWFE